MNFSIMACFQKKTNLKQGAHIYQPTAWPVPHAWPVAMDSSFALVSTQIRVTPDQLSMRMPGENCRTVPS